MSAYGIEALNVYPGLATIPVPVIFAGRGLDQARIANLMMRSRSVGLPFEDPVTNAVNAAKPLLDALTPEGLAAVELLVTSTESGLDLSKSVASYVHEYLGLSRNCRVLEVKQACYAATGMLQLVHGYLAAGLSPGAKAMIIATDVALVDARAGYAEPATGHGAVALLLSDQPRVLAIDQGAFGIYGYETMDSARPTPEFDIADVDRSLFAYLDCLAGSFRDYQARVDGVDFTGTFGQLAMHTPFAGLVKAAHRKMMLDFGDPGPVQEDFERRVLPSLAYPAQVGNLCSGSVYLALASLLDHAGITESTRVGLYSYGSGCAAEFYSGLVDAQSAASVGAMGIGAQLAGRRELTFTEYASLLESSLDVLVPRPDRLIDLRPYEAWLPDRRFLVHTATKRYHRIYDWCG
jgi:polyketide biosynthesis 3-hydroxy-3-methylglutaryl-CoA synthase-like enzyme PksG